MSKRPDRHQRGMFPQSESPPSEPKLRSEWLGSIAYASIEGKTRRPWNRWDQVEVRAADELWIRLQSQDGKTPFANDSDAREFANSVRWWSMQGARADINRGGRAFNYPRLVESFDEVTLRVPFVQMPDSPEDLAIQTVIVEEVDKLISKGSRRVRDVAAGIKEGLTLAEIDRTHGSRASSKAWERFRRRLAASVAQRLNEKDE